MSGSKWSWQSASAARDGPCRAEQANAALNLNLGLPLIDADSPRLRWLCRFLNDILLPPRLEALLFRLWSAIPLRFKQILTRGGWAIYLPLHRILLGRRTGLHPDASPEYHSLTTLLWWGRLFPVTVERMRFSLGQLGGMAPSRGPSTPPRTVLPVSGRISRSLRADSTRHDVRSEVVRDRLGGNSDL